MTDYPLAEFTPESAPGFARWVAKWNSDEGGEWDFSLDSLLYVEVTISYMRQGGIKPEPDARMLLAVGCYLGEVLVRHAQGKWVPGTDAWVIEGVGAAPILIELPHDLGVCNPLAWPCDQLIKENVVHSSAIVHSIVSAVHSAHQDRLNRVAEVAWSYSEDPENHTEFYMVKLGDWVAVVFRPTDSLGVWGAFLENGQGVRRLQAAGMTLFLDLKSAQLWCIEELAKILAAAQQPSANPSVDESIQPRPVLSSNIATVGHDANRNILEVEFQDGSVYRYYEVPRDVYLDMVNDFSAGSFLARHIKGHYRTQKM